MSVCRVGKDLVRDLVFGRELATVKRRVHVLGAELAVLARAARLAVDLHQCAADEHLLELADVLGLRFVAANVDELAVLVRVEYLWPKELRPI